MKKDEAERGRRDKSFNKHKNKLNTKKLSERAFLKNPFQYTKAL